jgi:hypothetical protein
MPWKPYDWPANDPWSIIPMPWVPKASSLCIWKTKGPNCPACDKLANRVYPLAYWQATVMPGFHEHCDCSLVSAPGGAFASPHDLWGTDPFWWDPSENVVEFLSKLFTRYVQWLANRGKGDIYSGFDNLYPVFMSESGTTTAGGTLQWGRTNFSPLFELFKEWLGLGDEKFTTKYKIRIYGLASVSFGSRSIFEPLAKPQACMPWESYPTEPQYDDPYPEWY